jgi:hypothetical protein
MSSFSAIFAWVAYAIYFSLCPITLFLIFHRKLYRRLKVFTVYIFLLVVWGVLWALVARTPSFTSHTWFDIYFSVEFSLSFLRLLTIAEISRRLLRGYPAVWALASWLLIIVTVGLLSWTVQSAIHNVHHIRRFILLGDQRFECMQAILVLLVISIGVYYRVQIPRVYMFILVGIGIYASIQVADNPLGIRIAILPNSIFDYIRRVSILLSLGFWLAAVCQPPRLADAEPEQISQATYDELAPKVHDHLKELNDKLEELVGKRR